MGSAFIANYIHGDRPGTPSQQVRWVADVFARLFFTYISMPPSDPDFGDDARTASVRARGADPDGGARSASAERTGEHDERDARDRDGEQADPQAGRIGDDADDQRRAEEPDTHQPRHHRQPGTRRRPGS